MNFYIKILKGETKAEQRAAIKASGSFSKELYRHYNRIHSIQYIEMLFLTGPTWCALRKSNEMK